MLLPFAGPQQVKGCILADLAQHLLKAYDAEQETQSPGSSQAQQRICDSAAHFGTQNSSRQLADTRLGKASAVAQQEVPAATAAAAAALRGDPAADASEEISTCSEMQSSGDVGDDGGDTQSDNSMHGHSAVGADTAEVRTPYPFLHITQNRLLHTASRAQRQVLLVAHMASLFLDEEAARDPANVAGVDTASTKQLADLSQLCKRFSGAESCSLLSNV